MIKNSRTNPLFDIKEYFNSKKRIRITLSAITFLLISFLLIHKSQNEIHDLPNILDSGRLVVLTDDSSLGFRVKGDSVSGFQYEIIKAFADTLGVELVISDQNDLKKGVTQLKNGEYDIIASLVPITTEWGNDALFTTPILATRQVLVQRLNRDSIHSKTIKKQLQLSNDTVFIPENSPYKMRLLNLSNEIANSIHIVEVKNANSEQLVHLVSAGKIKSTICDEHLSDKFATKYKNLDMSLPIGFTQQVAWMVNPKSKKLLNELNDFLSDFIGSSAYWKIYRKYYN